MATLETAYFEALEAIASNSNIDSTTRKFERAATALGAAITQSDHSASTGETFVEIEAFLSGDGEKELSIPLPGYSKADQEDQKDAGQQEKNSTNNDARSNLIAYRARIEAAQEVRQSLQETKFRVQVKGWDERDFLVISSLDPGREFYSNQGSLFVPKEGVDWDSSEIEEIEEAYSGSIVFEVGKIVPLRHPTSIAPSTRIDLSKIGAKAGDRIRVVATPFNLQGEVETRLAVSTAEFMARELGWHSRFVPYAMLVQPMRLKSDKEDFKLAASLAWLNRYTPRSEDNSGDARFWRLLSPSIGLHTALLDFNPDADAEIGFGLTLGLFEDRILLGYGANFMAEADDDGRYYFYFGSDLISLLSDRESKSN